jgi:hypothetical protein
MKRNSTENSSQEAVSGTQSSTESPDGQSGASENLRPRGSHGARVRRREAARKQHNGPEAQCL